MDISCIDHCIVRAVCSETDGREIKVKKIEIHNINNVLDSCRLITKRSDMLSNRRKYVQEIRGGLLQ